jgi:hypothetical protein
MRLERYSLAEWKYRRARQAAGLLRWLPFVRMVAVCNNLAFNNSRSSADIDLFIIIRPGRMWLTRFLITLVTHLAKMRRHGNKITDRICLSFYATERALDMRPLLLRPADPYFMYWLAQLVPIYDRYQTYVALRQANNWLAEHLPNLMPIEPVSRRCVTDQTANSLWYKAGERWLGGGLGGVIESICRAVQLYLMDRKKKSQRWQGGTAVVVNDDILKFHEDDRRQLFLEQWRSRMGSVS